VSRRRASFAAAAVLALGGCAGSDSATSTTATDTAPTPATTAARELGPPREQAYFGRIDSLTRSDDGYELRFDPAWFLSGETANVAAAEDGAVEPGEPVPNDNYVVDEGHRLLTFHVPAGARVSVLTRSGDAADFGATRIDVDELAKLVAGTSTLDLFEPLESGIWLRVDIDTVQTIDQQYRP
jgi:hypothetical protein